MPLLPRRPTAPTPARDVAARTVWDLPEASQAMARPSARPQPTGARPGAVPDLVVERVAPADAARHRDAWLDLMGRALEANVFLDPDFALPAAQHLDVRRRPSLILVWADAARGPTDLLAVWAVVDRAGPGRALAVSWLHEFSTLGMPLLDGERADAALRALLRWAAKGVPGARGLVVRAMPADGPTAAALRRAAAGAGHAVAVLDSVERAVLRRGSPRAGLAALSAKGAKDLRRQRRRLAERGALAYTSARDGDALRSGVERFLALEAAGWKGAAGTALLARTGHTAFARTTSRLLGPRGLWRVDSLALDGEPIAMALLLRAGSVDFLWKIAYREDAARLSPGVQLVLHITEAQLGDAAVSLTDSCAVPRHPMIDRLWRDRLRLEDIAVASRPGPSRTFAAAVAAERGLRRLRGALKRAVVALRKVRRRGDG